MKSPKELQVRAERFETPVWWLFLGNTLGNPGKTKVKPKASISQLSTCPVIDLGPVLRERLRKKTKGVELADDSSWSWEREPLL